MGKKEKRYVRGNAKEKVFDSGSPLLNLSFNIHKFMSQQDGGVEAYADDKGWVQITVGAKREIDQYGNSHAIWLNEWVKDPNWKPKTGNDPVPNPDDNPAPC